MYVCVCVSQVVCTCLESGVLQGSDNAASAKGAVRLERACVCFKVCMRGYWCVKLVKVFCVYICVC